MQLTAFQTWLWRSSARSSTASIAPTWALLAALITALAITVAPPHASAAATAHSTKPETDQPPDFNVAKLSAVPERSQVLPGERLAVAVILELSDTWHVWPNKPVVPKELDGLTATPTVVHVGPKDEDLTATVGGVTLRADLTQYPAPKAVQTGAFGNSLELLSYKGRAVMYVPVMVAPDAAPGERSFKVFLSFQACNDSVCAPPDTISAEVKLTVLAAGASPTASTGAERSLFAAFDGSVLASMHAAPPSLPPPAPGSSSAGPSKTPQSNAAMGGAAPGTAGATAATTGWKSVPVLGFDIPIPSSGAGELVAVLLFALVGGFVLNLTPCVLPVIPLKIRGVQMSAGTPQRAAFLGLMTFLGVVFSWTAMGAVIAGSLLSGVSELSSFWQFNLAVGLFMLVMAVGTIGVFNVNLPNWAYAFNPDTKTGAGAFKFGILTMLLATPCVAPLAGFAASWVLTQPWTIAIGVFTTMGIGMGFPYFVLSAYPKLLAFVPRAGPSSDLLKQVLALLMLATAAFFIGVALINLVATYPWLGKSLHWWLAGALAAGAGLWLIWRTFAITPSPARRVVFTLVGLALGAGGLQWARIQDAASHEAYVRDRDARAAELAELRAAVASGGKGGAILANTLWRPYDAAEVDKAIADGKLVVLEFTAEWCFICKALEASVLNTDPVQAALKRDGVVSFKADLTSRSAPGWDRVRALKEGGIPLLAMLGPKQPGAAVEPWKSNAYTIRQIVDEVDRRLGATASTAPPAAGASPGGG